uniref:Peptidase S1 domain-containing protein n=1 Tax=Equus asinus TaxID=9793 RepID=A0A9L0JRN2_EQUAS
SWDHYPCTPFTGALPPIQSRIIGGWECEKHSKPWQVAVYHQGHFQCGGVLVHPQWVLTAAHCMSDDYQIWLGRHNLSEDEDTAQFHQVSDSFLDPQFDLSLLKKKHLRPYDDISHDLMLLRLAQPARITDAVKILDLPTREPKLGSTCYTSGWGLISTLTSTPGGEAGGPRQWGLREEGTEKPGATGHSCVSPLPIDRGSGTLQCVELRLQSNEKCARAYPEKMTEFVLCATHRDDSGSGSICLVSRPSPAKMLQLWGSGPRLRAGV